MVHALVLLSYANAVGELFVFGRLAQLRLIRRYKWFAAWMAFSAVRDLSILIATDSHLKTTAFWSLWEITEPVMMGLVVLVAFEVYDLITSHFRTLGNVGEMILVAAVSIGAVVSVVLILIDSRGAFPWIFLVKRIVTSVLAVALMCVSWVFFWVADPIRPNVVRHCRILTVYLTAIALGYFFINFGVERVLANLLFFSVLLGCLVAWIVLIRRDGEVPEMDRYGEGTPQGQRGPNSTKLVV